MNTIKLSFSGGLLGHVFFNGVKVTSLKRFEFKVAVGEEPSVLMEVYGDLAGDIELHNGITIIENHVDGGSH